MKCSIIRLPTWLAVQSLNKAIPQSLTLWKFLCGVALLWVTFLLFIGRNQQGAVDHAKIYKKKALKIGKSFVAGQIQTERNELIILDRVEKDKQRRIFLRRIAVVKEAPSIVLSCASVKIPKELPAVFNTSTWHVDYERLCIKCHRYIVAATFATGVLSLSDSAVRNVLIIGLGGGALNNFYRHSTTNVNVTSVELDPAMLKLAKLYFGYVEDDRQHCIIKDGVIFLKELAQQGRTFDAVVLDTSISNEKVIMSPVPSFLKPETIQLLSTVLKETGALFVNYLMAGETSITEAEILKAFELFFNRCVSSKIANSSNKYIVCVKTPAQFELMEKYAYKRELNNYVQKLNFDLTVGF